MAAVCEHGAECHTGLEPSMASAPEASRAWLLIEHPGPWPHEAAEAALPAPLARAGRIGGGVRHAGADDPQAGAPPGGRRASVFWAGPRATRPGCAAGRCPRPPRTLTERDLKELADGIVAVVRVAVGEPVFLVCTHGRRNVCCARFGGPLAQALADPASRAGVGDHARRRAPVRRQPGDLAARPVLRPGRPGRGHRRDQRVPARRGRGRPVPGPGGPAEADPGGGVRAAARRPGSLPLGLYAASRPWRDWVTRRT